MSTPLDQIRQLPFEEKPLSVHQIWNGLHDSTKLFQDWRREVARDRLAELKADTSISLSEQEVWKRVDELLDE